MTKPSVSSKLVLCAALASCALALHARTAAAGCGAVPGTVAADPFGRMLLYGDSLTVGLTGNPSHYGNVAGRILVDSYCDFEFFEIEAVGQRGSHYARYARRIDRDLTAPMFPFDFVMFQDAGRALKLSSANNPGSARLFPNAVQDTVDAALAATPGIRVLVATTAPLDLAHATSSWQRRYENVDDFALHNEWLRSFAAMGGHTVVEWDVDVCAAYAAAPAAQWTQDGVHPLPLGDAAMALSVLKALGVPREDLVLDGVVELASELDLSTMIVLADAVYDPPAQCLP